MPCLLLQGPQGCMYARHTETHTQRYSRHTAAEIPPDTQHTHRERDSRASANDAKLRQRQQPKDNTHTKLISHTQQTAVTQIFLLTTRPSFFWRHTKTKRDKQRRGWWLRYMYVVWYIYYIVYFYTIIKKNSIIFRFSWIRPMIIKLDTPIVYKRRVV